MAISGNLLSANAESIETDASAWQGLVNATNLRRGTGGTLGSFCLAWTATAAGDTQVGLVSRVAVTPGQPYFSCSSIFPSATGAQSRIEVRWYTSGGTLISTSQGPQVSAPATTWHQVGVVGTAPSTAATADVVIRATATAAGQTWFADRVFLGLATTSAGNLLSFNAETAEVDTSGWTATTNATLSISTSAYSWYQGLRITAPAAGASAVQSAEAPTVTPGAEYAGYVHVSPGTSGLTVRVQLLWRAADGSTLSTTSATWTPASGSWTRCVVAGVAPAGAASARLVLAPTATAAGQTWVCDAAVLAPTSALMVPGNLLPYNVSDIEVDATGWTVTGGTATQSSTMALTSGYSLKMVAAGGTSMVATMTVPIGGVQEGYGYQFAPCLVEPYDRTYQTRIEWLDSSGAALRTRWQTWIGHTGAWLIGTMGDLAPDGAVAAQLSVVIPNPTAGETWYMDRVEWKVGGLTTKAVATGAAGATITVRGLSTGGPTWTWSLHRIVSGEDPAYVRGWDGDLVAQPIIGDVAVATDYEAPLGVPVRWRATIKDPAGSSQITYTSDPITLDAETTDVWLTDPGLPQRSCQLTVSTPMPTWTREARQSVSYVRGRALPVVISDVRSGKAGDLTVVTQTDAERQALWWVLDSGGPLLLRWPPGWDEEDIYVSVGTVSAAPVVEYAEFSDRTWVLPLTQVDRPIGGVTGSASRTWQTVKDAGSSWSAVLSGASSWLDLYTGA